MTVTNKLYITIDLRPAFEAVYGRRSALICLGKLKEIREAYGGGKNHV